jgi:GNAT superfamily N-acetyltransferase
MDGAELTSTELAALRAKGEALLPYGGRGFRLVAQQYGPSARPFRQVFDTTLAAVHYAGRCQRVGRCMRLSIMDGRRWVGGVVLGSTFANVGCRDEALGLKIYIRGQLPAGVRGPWSRENRAYWDALQTVVNHARTFVFPEFQGRGVGIRAHRLLLTAGIDLWEARYPGAVMALDTLCDSNDSGLFRRNGWIYAGRTKGFGSDRSSTLVDPASGDRLRNNVALKQTGRPWEVWVHSIGSAGGPS